MQTISKYSADDRIGQAKMAIATGTPALPVGSYSLIVADPPWQFHLRETDHTHQGRCSYPAMSIEAICELGVGEIIAPEAYLLLWTTKDHLEQAFRVARAWGFTYKSLHTWRKVTKDGTRVHFGVGHYGRNATEFFLVCTHGNPGTFTSLDLAGVPTIFDAPRGRHSEKPEAFYTLAGQLGNALGGQKLDLFARRQREGWAALGNEIDGLDIRDSLALIAAGKHG